jgi:hypothetical protein
MTKWYNFLCKTVDVQLSAAVMCSGFFVHTEAGLAVGVPSSLLPSSRGRCYFCMLSVMHACFQWLAGI